MLTVDELKNYWNKYPKWTYGISRSKKLEHMSAYETILTLTDYLPDTVRLQTRAWHILNNITTIPTCGMCGKNCRWDNHKNDRYTEYCLKCAKSSDSSKEKRKQTNILRFGAEVPLRNPDILKKAQETNIERYGNHFSLKNEDVAAKAKETMLEKYGVENPSHSDIIKEKRHETFLERYNVDNPFQYEEFKEKIKETNLKRYGVERPAQNPDILQKMIDTNLEKYGVKFATEIDGFVEQARQTNLERYGYEYHMNSHISDETMKLLNDKDWLIQKHHDEQMSMASIAKLLNVCDGTVSSRMEFYDIEHRYYYASGPEKEVAAFIKTYFDDEVLTNTKVIISPSELDIYIPSKQIAIEFNGLYWHSEAQKPDNYHHEKYLKCKEKGIQLIQIFEDEWTDKRELVEQKLLYALNVSNMNKVHARKTTIVEIDSSIKKGFLDRHHIQGDGPSSINYGLIYDNELIAVIGFINNNDESFTLNRYATSCHVVGGFSKLLKHFENEWNHPKIITFADLRWSNGDLYHKNGFIVDKNLDPDYYWIKSGRRYHKFGFRHVGMKSKLENYDPSLSETKNMHRHGFLKIYDAGKIKFIKND